ncbi:MAG TPA: hypothetical protein VFF00_08345, partial [Candidatus Elarobacter sp.]|nr:hypothetical protein [Candidatus Elarobacter sp.]
SGADAQRVVVLSALSTGLGFQSAPAGEFHATAASVAAAGPLDAPGGVFMLTPLEGSGFQVLAVSWCPGDVESAAWEPHRSNGTLRMVLAPGWRRVTYSIARVRTREAALAFVEAERAWAAANPVPARR